MAIFRKINVSFWEDTKVADEMTPEDKYFMLYLMTNPHTTQSGCYSITIRQMEFETGYNKETILKLLNRFIEILKILKYSETTKELLIKNWYKYNWTKSPKVLKCIVKEAETIKNKEFRYYINTLLIQYGYSIDTETQEEQEEEQEQEKEKEKKQELEQEKTKIKKLDPYCNPLKTFFIDEYEKVFGNRPKLSNANCNRVIELASENEDFKEILPTALKKMKDIDWKKINFTPSVQWLLKDDHFYSLLNGEYDNKEKAEEEQMKEFWRNL